MKLRRKNVMTEWRIKPHWKKSTIERNYLTKNGETIMVETGWRWGEFSLLTEDDKIPNIEPGVDMYNNDYDCELVETTDGCWEEVVYDDVSDETREWLEEFFEENNWLDLEEHGWSQDECEMIIDCDLLVTKMNEDGTEGETYIISDDGEPVLYSDEVEEVVVKQTPKPIVSEEPPKWPFDRPKEGSDNGN
jgi:hypothetical protein